MDPRLRLSIAEYKVLSARTLTGASFVEYAAKRRLLDESLLARLGRDVTRADVLAEWVRPVFALERADLRVIPDAQVREPNYLVGLQIDVRRRSAAEALSVANALFEYVRDTVILLRARQIASSLSFRASSQLLALDRAMVRARFELAQADARHKDLSAIRARYPEAARGDVRQVISVDESSSRFLPPAVQLVGAETQMAELRETLRRAEWETERSRALLAFLEPAQRIIEKARGTAELFQPLEQLMTATFTATRLEAEPWRDARAAVDAELLVLRTLYSGPMGLTKAPTVSEPSLQRRALPALIGLVLGAVLAASVLLVRDRIVRPSPRPVTAGV